MGRESECPAWSISPPSRRGTPCFAESLDQIWVPRFYRGRLVGFVQREDHKGALRKLAGLDRGRRS